MPVPKRRKSQSRSRMQRAANMRMDFEALPGHCQSCQEPKAPHRICPSCGKYGEKQIIPVLEK
jgi:large subunit ribosomal protein L32